ncbi:unnamed protein product [Moneuplotes crassus]|uniref:Uncharacterized protein n=1 Tax=Euplotes crassus TaxID=5936 RepID=A0AAD1XMS2_EUPCR|nr:unnamed protein product [Moneuplotes crassus]
MNSTTTNFQSNTPNTSNPLGHETDISTLGIYLPSNTPPSHPSIHIPSPSPPSFPLLEAQEFHNLSDIFNPSNGDEDEELFKVFSHDHLDGHNSQKENEHMQYREIQEEFYEDRCLESSNFYEFKYFEQIKDNKQLSKICEVEQKVEEPPPKCLSGKKNKSKSKRWGKKQDIALFNEFRKYESKGYICFEDLKKVQFRACNSSFNIIKTIRSTLETEKSCEFLVSRLINNTNDKFSVRETKLLKRLIRRSDYKNLDYLKLLESFRGKTLDGIRKACDNLCQEKNKKTLHKVTNLEE